MVCQWKGVLHKYLIETCCTGKKEGNMVKFIRKWVGLFCNLWGCKIGLFGVINKTIPMLFGSKFYLIIFLSK